MDREFWHDLGFVVGVLALSYGVAFAVLYAW